MTRIDDIRKAFFEEGNSISEILKKLSTDHKMVMKYISTEAGSQN